MLHFFAERFHESLSFAIHFDYLDVDYDDRKLRYMENHETLTKRIRQANVMLSNLVMSSHIPLVVNTAVLVIVEPMTILFDTSDKADER